MGLEFITRVIRTSAILALITGLAVSVYFDWRIAAGFLVGTSWGLLNLYFLKRLITEAISPEVTRTSHVILIVLLKFPLLYVGGYFIVAWGYFSIYSLLAGFSLMFLVMILKILGRMIMGMDTPGLTGKAPKAVEGRH